MQEPFSICDTWPPPSDYLYLGASEDQKRCQEIHRLIYSTSSHKMFPSRYMLPSYEEGWARTPRVPLSCDTPPRLLAVDCEMYKTEAGKFLSHVSIVDEECQVLVNDLVLPSHPVEEVDPCEEITGITRRQLEGALLTVEEAQAKVVEMVTPGTVLVGHGLHHDLQALQLDHGPVIDTALVFSLEVPYTRPSMMCSPVSPPLSFLVRSLLGDQEFRMSGKHSANEDAALAMKLVLEEIQQGPSPPLLSQTSISSRMLLVHYLPRGTTVGDVKALFQRQMHPPSGPCRLLSCLMMDFGKRALMEFVNEEAALEVFDQLPCIDQQRGAETPSEKEVEVVMGDMKEMVTLKVIRLSSMVLG